MLEIFLITILFIIGIYFGSFFTLATYRLPIKENIIYKHSYCPNCNHKLGVFDLVPIFSYIFLGGKCHYCKNSIGIRYFLFELLTGLVFVLFGISLKIDIYSLEIEKIVYLLLGILYFASLFMIAGINKEKNIIQKSVLYFGVLTSILYIIYSCTLGVQNVYKYVIYLILMGILIVLDILYFKKNLKYNEKVELLILVLIMLIITGAYNTISSLLLTILIIGIENIILHIKTRKRAKVVTKKEKRQIAFYICVSNIIMCISTNLFINYILK